MTAKVKTSTSSSLFNAYVEQSYLDNSLRGGLPVIFGDDNSKVTHPLQDPPPPLFYYITSPFLIISASFLKIYSTLSTHTPNTYIYIHTLLTYNPYILTYTHFAHPLTHLIYHHPSHSGVSHLQSCARRYRERLQLVPAGAHLFLPGSLTFVILAFFKPYLL